MNMPFTFIYLVLIFGSLAFGAIAAALYFRTKDTKAARLFKKYLWSWFMHKRIKLFNLFGGIGFLLAGLYHLLK